MAKRLTDADKWKDPWFRNLDYKYKIFWIYLLDSCDCAGFWKVDVDYATFHIGAKFKIEDVLAAMNDGKQRLVNHGEHWELTGFRDFQYGVLREDVKPHRPVVLLLEKYRTKGYCKGIDTLPGRVQEKEKEKEKEKEGIVKGGFQKPSLEDLAEALEAGGLDAATALAEAKAFLDYYESVGWVVGRTRKPMKNWRGAISTWIKNRREWEREGRERPNPMNFNKKQLANMEALNDFAERKRTAGPEDLRSGNGSALKRVSSDQF